MKSTERFDPKRGKFGTFMYSCVKNGLIDWGMRNDLPLDPISLPEDADQQPDPCRALMVKEWLAGLPNECREVAMIILNGPAETLGAVDDLLGRKKVLGALRGHLREQGWTWSRIWKTIRAMKREVAAL